MNGYVAWKRIEEEVDLIVASLPVRDRHRMHSKLLYIARERARDCGSPLLRAQFSEAMFRAGYKRL